MANKSNWKGSEEEVAKIFPGGKRRTRVGGGTYAEVADDVKWLFDEMRVEGKTPRVIKMPLSIGKGQIDPIYIEVKKRASNATVSIFKQSEKKYFVNPDDRLVLAIHVKKDKRRFLMVDDAFFEELLYCWCSRNGVFDYINGRSK